MKTTEQKTILIIDDNAMNLLVASKTLENFGFRIITAENGLEGIEILRKEQPDLILLDIMMPEVDGYEVCRQIKKVDEWKEIPVIFLTANSQTEDLIEGFRVGGVDYITKPFKSEELLVRIKNHIELFESKKTIENMVRSRDKLYSIIAHDIRSPLSGIQQTIDAIDQGFFDPNSEDFKEIIHHLNNRTRDTATLLNSLLQWTRLQSDTIPLEFQLIETGHILQSCINLLEANANNKSIRIEKNLPDNLFAWCDEVSLHTIFRNLISNAIKFTPNGGYILIDGKSNEFSVEISVKDSGIGMSEETINKIFKKNEHHTSFGTSNEQGTGLGLMLVKDFVTRNNGTIEAFSTEGLGTTIKVKIPARK